MTVAPDAQTAPIPADSRLMALADRIVDEAAAEIRELRRLAGVDHDSDQP